MKYITYVLLLSNIFLFGQNTTKDNKLLEARKFIEAYNLQNYNNLYDVFPRKVQDLDIKRMKEIEDFFEKTYKGIYDEFGKMAIDTLYAQNSSQIYMKLIFEKDKEEFFSIGMYFDSLSNVQGLWQNDPDFIFPKIKNKNISITNKNVKIDSIVKKITSKNEFNGNILAIDNGKVIYKKNFGYSNFETKLPLNDSSLFELASCSKQFTAMAIMILSEQGKLNYSDNIQKYMPDLLYQNITIENLLTHTSGLPDYMDEIEKHWDKTKFATNYDIIELFKIYKPEPDFQPNEKFSYSNTGYALLSIIIEKASGMKYGEFLGKYIFKPAGMNHSRVYNTRRSKKEIIDNYAYGYVYSDSLKKNVLPDSLPNFKYVIYDDAITGDGTVNSTITDLAIWDKALFENKLVSKSTLEKAYIKHKLNNGKESKYGYGVFIQNNEGSEKIVYHSGGWPGYHTFIFRDVEFNKSVIVLSNNKFSGISDLTYRIAKILLKDN